MELAIDFNGAASRRLLHTIFLHKPPNGGYLVPLPHLGVDIGEQHVSGAVLWFDLEKPFDGSLTCEDIAMGSRTTKQSSPD
ncbi:hypothetical protein IEQ34_010329 [Dendrobium chrysotoxum]|uniref:Uncharacterized protein n=1 Tax=Dendrobium chrysotoxum TaxID=161865 RepID=A0AAV7H4S1_DENCH|nr:hypothetical protein IEQ34_010329 [Dendrobium chrysotoxum]